MGDFFGLYCLCLKNISEYYFKFSIRFIRDNWSDLSNRSSLLLSLSTIFNSSFISELPLVSSEWRTQDGFIKLGVRNNTDIMNDVLSELRIDEVDWENAFEALGGTTDVSITHFTKIVLNIYIFFFQFSRLSPMHPKSPFYHHP